MIRGLEYAILYKERGDSMVRLIDIYWKFFKISSITFGGGYAMIPILRKEMIENDEWVTEEEIIDIYALSQGLPGIIAVNVAAFIGHKKRGVKGAIIGGLGIVSPCILIILAIAMFLSNFQDSMLVKNAFAGISVSVTALIFSSVMSLWKKSMVDKFCGAIFALTLLLMLFTKISPFIFVLIGAFGGVIYMNRVDRV